MMLFYAIMAALALTGFGTVAYAAHGMSSSGRYEVAFFGGLLFGSAVGIVASTLFISRVMM